MGFFERLKEGLSKTRRNFTDRIQELVGLSAAIHDDFLDELEMILLSADVGCYSLPEKIYGRDAGRQRPTYTYRCQADGYSGCWR